MGFGFVAGSEKPVVVRFVTDGGPSVNKLLPGDQILAVNGEDVKAAPREHVISLVRACSSTVTLKVCQPAEQTGIRKSTLLSASKRARLKSKPPRVRFAESVCVNGAPLFPPSAFSLSDVCVPPMANVLKVFLENGQTKSFKYDAWTTVKDVVTSLQNKLCIQATEHFSLVVEHIKSLRRNKLTLLDPNDTLARIAAKPGAHKLRCLFRIAFVPSSPATLAQKDLAGLDYLYAQCCNDVTQERFAPELQYDTALQLAALHIYQHSIAHNVPLSKLTIKNVDHFLSRKEFGLERFVPASLLENMKRKEVHKFLAHFLKLHSNMAGSGKPLTALQAKLHYLDLVSQLPSYGAKCFSAGPRGDSLERVILVSPKFGLSQIIGARSTVVFQPVPIANIEDIKRIQVKTDDELTRTVLVQLENDKVVTIALEERDASELVLVLRGYYHIMAGKVLPVEQEEVPRMEDLAPPYLSQHRVIPEKWSYITQNQIKAMCFAMHPIYKNINHKTNGLYNTVGRQSKPPFMTGLSLDSNMNNTLASNRNHERLKNHFVRDKSNSYDLQSVTSLEVLEGGVVEAKNEEVLRRVREMHQLVENSEKYLNEQEQYNQLNSESEWQETSVDFDSDLDGHDDAPGTLKHSDSLLLLIQGRKQAVNKQCMNAAIELLRSELNQSESDNDSIGTPNNSPVHKMSKLGGGEKQNRQQERFSFGLRSPEDVKTTKDEDLKAYLQKLKNSNADSMDSDTENLASLYDFDPDITDLTLIPPPATPDELDSALMIVNQPPTSFADSLENINRIDDKTFDLEAFLANVTVPPPTQKLTPAVELTPEEIMSFIIPPPPSLKASFENLTINNSRDYQSLPPNFEQQQSLPQQRKENGDHCPRQNVIEYATVDRKGPFSCCSRAKTSKTNELSEEEQAKETSQPPPPPRRGSEEKPPDRPPKPTTPERQRSHSLSSASFKLQNEPAPTLPPRTENSQAPPHLFLPPKKPPLPPIPPLEVLRSRILASAESKNNSERRTACIGSPHLQRNKHCYSDLEISLGLKEERAAVSTPTSPFLGRGSQLTIVPISSPESPKILQSNGLHSPKIGNGNVCMKERERDRGETIVQNGCTSTNGSLLNKTDVAMTSLLDRINQIANQCNAAQVHGGGKMMCEDKFQVSALTFQTS
ncbi:uncharacterized protein LOC108738555 isoform X2 [Agrilus planipennis]|uniref:Uncharacterized protein LOC108738555 isoform X2 n=1 Tax=Agrilus planipennis TaxID=224129 RepID=A0A7F5RDE6_AGRPL|nr:uncharacterized protein LOC108738555 isoform X2 [Agrilus planipennis]